MRIQCLGKSYQGRDIPLITIGNPYSKFIIMMSARTHPGETVGSWMMEGFLK
jgi:murein tripeptide amidase MpaA